MCWERRNDIALLIRSLKKIYDQFVRNRQAIGYADHAPDTFNQTRERLLTITKPYLMECTAFYSTPLHVSAFAILSLTIALHGNYDTNRQRLISKRSEIMLSDYKRTIIYI